MTDLTNIRVRFAPSPTGYLHIGGLRTALFNYLFARHNNGKFILRIEDTDQQRKVEGAVENLIKTLKSIGLEYDEGPEIGGEYGPYFQSQRLDIYKKYIEQLLSQGDAYYAFETAEEIEEMRKLQIEQGAAQAMYDRSARNLTKEQVEEKIKQGIPYVIRLKVPQNSEVSFNDLIRGTVTIDTNLVDDQVLMKSDGYPTYHFANVIDDHLMQITHVIRGEEWLTSVPKHILLYKALGWEASLMAHVPLILNPDRTKLSKRQGDVATEDFLRKGYLPDALVNFIALLGWNPGEGENKEIFSLEELVKLFTIERVQTSGAVFNLEKLNWMNAEYIKNYDMNKLAELAFPIMENAGFDITDREKVKRVVFAVRTYINKLDEIPVQAERYYKSNIELNEMQKEMLSSDSSKRVFESLSNKLNGFNVITTESFKPLLNEVQKETGIKGKNLFMPVRLALTGEEHGPELGLVAYVLGKDEVERRIKMFLNM
ncbi:MAG: glutamate--tRNA ligase [Ignavibacteriae bacterium]|nr:MAG: glutamate--tRNA ligase [Ignavibacteriota bacterium]